ncbi:hypothetical protein STEG23_027100, partial [Scotinomys teguina]
GDFQTLGWANNQWEKTTEKPEGPQTNSNVRQSMKEAGRDMEAALHLWGWRDGAEAECCLCPGSPSWFPAPTADSSQSPATPAARYLMLSSGLFGLPHSCKQTQREREMSQTPANIFVLKQPRKRLVSQLLRRLRQEDCCPEFEASLDGLHSKMLSQKTNKQANIQK